MMGSLKELCGILIDMDGVLWVGEQPLPGLAPFFQFLEANQIHYVLVSNNATRRADYTVARMGRMGVRISPDRVLTSADAAPRWLRLHLPEVKRVYVVGETALKNALSDAGIEVVESNADAVVAGMDRELTYKSLERATFEIRRGARFIATNGDRTFPTERGLAPGAGAIIAALVASTDVTPIIIGKPAQPMFELALQMSGTPAQATAMLGDRLDTDIDGAARAGMPTILVLTGVSSRADAERNEYKPSFIFDDLPGLQRAWQTALEK